MQSVQNNYRLREDQIFSHIFVSDFGNHIFQHNFRIQIFYSLIWAPLISFRYNVNCGSQLNVGVCALKYSYSYSYYVFIVAKYYSPRSKNEFDLLTIIILAETDFWCTCRRCYLFIALHMKIYIIRCNFKNKNQRMVVLEMKLTQCQK